MNLDTTTRSLEVKLGEAITTSQCDVTASFGEYAAAGFRPRLSDTVTNGVTAVTAVAAPATSEQLVVQEVRVYNADTVTHLVILQLNDNATIRVIQAGEVVAGGTFSYVATQPSDPNAAPAILLESGTTSEKISQLSAFSFATPPDGSEALPAVEASTTVRISLSQLLSLMLDWSETIATNPFDATAGNTDGDALNLLAGKGHGSGAGGFVFGAAGAGGATGDGGFMEFDGGAGGATSGDGGSWFVNGGAATVGNGGDVALEGGTSASGGNGGSVTFRGGQASGGGNASGSITFTIGAASGGATAGDIVMAGLPTIAPATTGALWRDAGAGNVVKAVP